MEMFKYLFSCLSLLAAFAGATAPNSNLVVVKNVVFSGSDQFPEVISLSFNHQGNDVQLNLTRADETTEMLSEDVFEASSFLPSDLFKEENSVDFAAYDSGGSNVMVVHRQSETANPKFYGRFMHVNEIMTIHSEDERHDLHRVWREMDMDDHHRVKRDETKGTPENVIELFIFADLSVYEHFRDEFPTTDKLKDFIKSYFRGASKEVDSIFKYLGVYGTSKTLRVYFQQYQVITEAKQQKWVENNLSDNKLQTTAVSDLQTYYYTLITKFSFPYPDHVMALTKLTMQGDVQVMSTGTVCGASSAVGTSIVRMDNFPVSLAQGIALTFSVANDGDGNGCLASDQYIMSTTYGAVTDPGNQGNRWKFSPCSVDKFQSALNGNLDLSCLQTEDINFNWVKFEKSPFLGERLTADEQCVIRYKSGAMFCDESQGGDVDCYSSSQGCLVNGVCKPFTVAQNTQCSSNTDNFLCQYGFCTITSTTTLSTTTTRKTTTRTTAMRTTTDGGDLQTTTSHPCVVKTSVEEYDIPGCSCKDCDPKSKSRDSNKCNPASECPGKKVKVTTTYVRKECAKNYKAGPRTVISSADEPADLIAEVSQKNNGKWQVELVPKV